ncbi:MAG: cell division protein ZapA [Bilifractor sp.]|jgi:cell division protein ZapA|nr:cell division protein ZapA [Lachnospiraceae bacterium]
MAEKHAVKVLIDGKAVTLSGYESEEYLQRVAFYLNNKISELAASRGYGHLTQDMKSTLLSLNIADDYFKAKEQADAMEQDIENRDQSAYDVKHDLIAAQMEVERLKKENEKLRNQLEGRR